MTEPTYLKARAVPGSVLIWLTRAFQGLSREPLPSTGNLLPSKRLRFGLPMPSEQAEINAVLRLNAQVDKFHWQRYAAKLQDGVCSYIARKASRIPRQNGERRLSDGPLDQSLRFVVVVVEKFFGLAGALELLFCHVTEELNVLKIEEITGIPYRYGQVKP